MTDPGGNLGNPNCGSAVLMSGSGSLRGVGWEHCWIFHGSPFSYLCYFFFFNHSSSRFLESELSRPSHPSFTVAFCVFFQETLWGGGGAGETGSSQGIACPADIFLAMKTNRKIINKHKSLHCWISERVKNKTNLYNNPAHWRSHGVPGNIGLRLSEGT